MDLVVAELPPLGLDDDVCLRIRQLPAVARGGASVCLPRYAYTLVAGPEIRRPHSLRRGRADYSSLRISVLHFASAGFDDRPGMERPIGPEETIADCPGRCLADCRWDHSGGVASYSGAKSAWRARDWDFILHPRRIVAVEAIPYRRFTFRYLSDLGRLPVFCADPGHLPVRVDGEESRNTCRNAHNRPDYGGAFPNHASQGGRCHFGRSAVAADGDLSAFSRSAAATVQH